MSKGQVLTVVVPVKVYNHDTKDYDEFNAEVTVNANVLAQRYAAKIWHGGSGKTELAYGAIKIVALRR